MRRLLPHLGFLPLLLLLAGIALAQEQAVEWDPQSCWDCASYAAGYAIAAVLFGTIVGLVIGLAGPWRAHMYRLRPGRIYPLH